MKTGDDAGGSLPAIVHLAGAMAQAPTPEGAPAQARAWAEPHLQGQVLDTGEGALAHADGVAAILLRMGAAPSLLTAAYLIYAADHLPESGQALAEAFGPEQAALAERTRKLVAVQRAARVAEVQHDQRALQTERVRKMLLAFAQDLRVVLLRLASRLQTLRQYAATRQECPADLAHESLQVFAPLANRLGIWQIKWELEDLAFRFLKPQEYRQLAAQLEQTRLQRETAVEFARIQMHQHLRAAGIEAEVHGRPKHLYSIWRKMQGKGLKLSRMFDLMALRVIVADVPACYAALSCVHTHYAAVPEEYDDYIARPKPNGYQSLHTVVHGPDGRAMEVQIRTQAMHEHAESGVAAHWAYKEAGAKGYAGVSAAGDYEERLAQARKTVLRQLLAWERDFTAADGVAGGAFDNRIYVFTPRAEVIELPAGATPVDFAYALHSSVGHRCRGAKVDGQLVPLQTALGNGQTVDIVTTKEGGPSRDWLNPELGYLTSHRARAKVRAWFNAQAQADTVARGREAVERLLQREGRTATNLEQMATALGFEKSETLFEQVGKEEYSLHLIEAWLRPPPPKPAVADDAIALRKPSASRQGSVLVVGVGDLLTQLARCCRPAPPDEIGGFVTRGKGVAIHRQGCTSYKRMVQAQPERVVPVAWGARPASTNASYPVQMRVVAEDRSGLLRDISEVVAKEKLNVIGAHTRTHKATGVATMLFTVEVPDAARLKQLLRAVAAVPGVQSAARP